MQEPEFLTFSELVHRWNCSELHLHHIVSAGEIVPAISLSNQERYPGGEFRGGDIVGDIDGSVHISYSEYYVGTNLDEQNYPENWPQCRKFVFLHHPDDHGNNDYCFQFFSEYPNSGMTTKWYYFAHNETIVGNTDGVRRFKFIRDEIERYEVEFLANKGHSSLAITGLNPESKNKKASNETSPVENFELDSQPKTVSTASKQVHETEMGLHTSLITATPLGVKKNQINKRKHVGSAEIEKAWKASGNIDDIHFVWTELCKMAESREGCLLGMDDKDIKYSGEDGVAFMTKKDFRSRLRRLIVRDKIR